MSRSREQVIEYLKGIDITGKRVLDVGCGPVNMWARNFVTGPHLIYKTLDINPEFNPDYVCDLNQFAMWAMIPEKFDVVFCLETLEHIFDPIEALNNLISLLDAEGVIYLSSPFINPIHDEHDFLRYTIQWFETALPYVGFRDIKITPRVSTSGREDLRLFYQDEGMRMSKITHSKGYGKNYFDIGYIVEARK